MLWEVGNGYKEHDLGEEQVHLHHPPHPHHLPVLEHPVDTGQVHQHEYHSNGHRYGKDVAEPQPCSGANVATMM